MTLPATGMISLNQVNVELGKAGTTPITMNDSAVRTLARVPSGGYGMASLRGKSAGPVATHSVTSAVRDYGFGNTYGCIIDNAQGSISPATFKGMTIKSLYWGWDFMLRAYTLAFGVAPNTLAQSWLTSLTINGVTYSASSAIYGAAAGGYTYSTWVWTVPANPLPAGATVPFALV